MLLTSSLVLLPRDQYDWARVVPSVRRSPRRRDIAIDASRSTSAARPESPRRSSARARPPSARARSSESSRGSAAAASSSSSTAPASWIAGRQHASSKPIGGAREELAVPQRACQLGGARERVERGVGTAGAMAGVAELEHHPRALVRIADAELERGAKPILGLAERERGDGRLGREQVVRDGPLCSADRRPCRVVVREGGEDCPAVAAGPSVLERLGDPEVDLRPARGREPVVDGSADELVREPVCEAATRLLDQQAAPHGLLDRADQRRLVHDRRAPHRVELEVGSHHGSQLEDVPRLAGEPREPLADDVPHRRRDPELGRRPGETRAVRADVDGGGVDQLAPELGDQERVAAGEVADDRRQLGGGLDAGRQPDELADLARRQPAEADAHDSLGAVHVDERLRELGGHVRVGVAEGGHEEHPSRRAGAHEVPHQLQRGRVGPVHVLEHEEQRCFRADADEQLGHGGVEAVALRIGVGRRGRGQLADARHELRHEPRQLSAARTEVLPQHLGLGVPYEVLEGGRERAVGRADDRVAVAVQHRRPLVGELTRQLPHETALPRARVAGDERRAAAFARAAGKEGPQRRKLLRPPGEGERGREPERAGKGSSRVHR